MTSGEMMMPSKKDSKAKSKPANITDILKESRILIVEDQADLRELYGVALRSYGAHVVGVDSVAEAIKTLKNIKMDGLVSDIGLPGADGYDLIRRVRALKPEHGRAIPALAISGFNPKETRERCLAEGYQDFLSKPVDPTEFCEAVARLIQPPNRSN